MQKKWIGVDLDGTLAKSISGKQAETTIGKPIISMLNRVKSWIDDGKYEVRIFTARAADHRQIPLIQKWLDSNHIGSIKITNAKDSNMVAMFDNIAIRLNTDTGEICTGCAKNMSDSKFNIKPEIWSYLSVSTGFIFDENGHIQTDC